MSRQKHTSTLFNNPTPPTDGDAELISFVLLDAPDNSSLLQLGIKHPQYLIQADTVNATETTELALLELINRLQHLLEDTLGTRFCAQIKGADIAYTQIAPPQNAATLSFDISQHMWIEIQLPLLSVSQQAALKKQLENLSLVARTCAYPQIRTTSHQ